MRVWWVDEKMKTAGTAGRGVGRRATGLAFCLRGLGAAIVASLVVAVAWGGILALPGWSLWWLAGAGALGAGAYLLTPAFRDE